MRKKGIKVIKWIFRTTNKRNLTKDLDIAKKGKPLKRD